MDRMSVAEYRKALKEERARPKKKRREIVAPPSRTKVPCATMHWWRWVEIGYFCMVCQKPLPIALWPSWRREVVDVNAEAISTDKETTRDEH